MILCKGNIFLNSIWFDIKVKNIGERVENSKIKEITSKIYQLNYYISLKTRSKISYKNVCDGTYDWLLNYRELNLS